MGKKVKNREQDSGPRISEIGAIWKPARQYRRLDDEEDHHNAGGPDDDDERDSSD
jgi:hypothetical protein